MPIFPPLPVVAIGHRGAAGHRPENTMESFELALTMGVHGLEYDVQLSQDGIPVVIHDPTLDRTTDGSGHVNAFSVEQLKGLDAGFRFSGPADDFPFRDRGIRISTLAEVLDAFPNVPAVIEMKADAGPAIAHATARVIADLRTQDRVIVGSFETELLRIIRRRTPRVRTNFGNSEVRNLFVLHHLKLHRLVPLHGDVLMLPPRYERHHLTTPSFRKATRSLNLQMHVWTVNDPLEMRQLIDLGVDGILTDYPDRLIHELRIETS
jgi:glycerophosphoryl diester phosphodiesterase